AILASPTEVEFVDVVDAPVTTPLRSAVGEGDVMDVTNEGDEMNDVDRRDAATWLQSFFEIPFHRRTGLCTSMLAEGRSLTFIFSILAVFIILITELIRS